MADDKTFRGPRDASRPALGEEYELRSWTDKFGVSAEKLRNSVVAVGNGADAVARHLKHR